MKKRAISIALLLALAIFSLTSCNLLHTHVWQYRLVKGSTCTEKGLLELFCIECGEKDYADLETASHNYQNGVCTDCGAAATEAKAITRSTIPAGADTEGKWTFESIYELASTFYDQGSYESFMGSLSGVTLKQAHLDSVGLFQVTVVAPTTERSGEATQLSSLVLRG